MIANYHTHTKWCNHGIGEIEDYIKAAIKAGLKEIAITEHVPHRDNIDLQRMRWEEFGTYNRELDEKIEKYKDKIKVIKGFECEYYPEALEAYKLFRDIYHYEIFVLGQHRSIDKQTDNFGVKGKEELYTYANEVCEALETGMFTFIAHPDLALEGYNEGKWDEHCEEAMRQIYAACERLNIPVEINANGVRGKKRYPDKNALKLSKEYKLTYLINADAHRPEYVYDDAVRAAEELAKELDITVTPMLKLKKDSE